MFRRPVARAFLRCTKNTAGALLPNPMSPITCMGGNGSDTIRCFFVGHALEPVLDRNDPLGQLENLMLIFGPSARAQRTCRCGALEDCVASA